jgi:pimeloyl-ACP methyl ester carboxylesterase
VLVERLVQVGDEPMVELFVAETSGDPDRTLLVIHGGPDWDQMYLREPLVELGGDRHVVFVDLRGCGRSTRGLPGPAHTPAAAVQDPVVLIDQLGRRPIDVLGFSYGGLLAQRLLVSAPEKVRRAVIASSSILPVPADAFAGWTEREARLVRAGAGADREVPWNDELTRRDAVSNAARDVWRLELLPEYLSRLEQVHFSSERGRAWPDRSKIPPARPEQVVDRLRALGKPLLLLHGRQDMTFPAALVKPTTELIPTARGVVLDEAGHMTHVDQPDAWLRAVRTFLDDSRE